jgi:hypothetical protein
MRTLILITFTSLIVNAKAFCQQADSLLSVYNNQTIYREGAKFIKGTEKLSFHDLNEVFISSSTKDLFHKSKSRRVISRIFSVASLALLAVSYSLSGTKPDGAIKITMGTSVLGLAGLYYQQRSSNYLDKAIWLQNREVLFGTR